MGKNKFFYDLKVLEKKPLLPSHIKALLKKLDDYGFAGFEVSGLSGTAEKSGDKYVFTARGSNPLCGGTLSEIDSLGHTCLLPP